MKTIHKYPLEPGDNRVQTFEGAKYLHVDTQFNGPVAWAEVDDEAKPIEQVIQLIPTGGEVPSGAQYLGTAVNVMGVFVFHAYLTP